MKDLLQMQREWQTNHYPPSLEVARQIQVGNAP